MTLLLLGYTESLFSLFAWSSLLLLEYHYSNQKHHHHRQQQRYSIYLLLSLLLIVLASFTRFNGSFLILVLIYKHLSTVTYSNIFATIMLVVLLVLIALTPSFVFNAYSYSIICHNTTCLLYTSPSPRDS